MQRDFQHMKKQFATMSMKLDIFGDWKNYGEIGDFPLIFLYKSLKFSTYTVIQMLLGHGYAFFIIWI